MLTILEERESAEIGGVGGAYGVGERRPVKELEKNRIG